MAVRLLAQNREILANRIPVDIDAGHLMHGCNLLRSSRRATLIEEPTFRVQRSTWPGADA
jgi:hypothetical protein